MDNMRVLVAGDVLGKYNDFFQRINNVNKKAGPFEIVLCAGSFFPLNDRNDELKNLTEISKDFFKNNNLSIYILGPINEFQTNYYKPIVENDSTSNFEDGFEIVEGITFLGKKGILNTAKQIKIAYLSGSEGKSSKFCFNKNDVDDLINICKISSVDVLITNCFPYGVSKHSIKSINESEKNTSILVSKLSYLIQPRYHFCADDNEFYEREPYQNNIDLNNKLKKVTRFISLAKVGNVNKQKWLYAFNIKLLDETVQQSDNFTDNPFSELEFDKININNSKNSSFFYDLNSLKDNNFKQNETSYKKLHNQNDNQTSIKKTKTEPTDCWFCLASPQVDKHLIISIGEHCYLALAKGGLVDYNMLILPIGHYRSFLQIQNDESLKDVSNEIGLFKNAIIDYFRSLDLVPVFFERNFRSNHLQIQIIPIQMCKIETLKQVLYEMCEERNFKLNEIPKNLNFNEVLSNNIPYFYIQFLSEQFFIRIKASKGFSMYFGREVLAHSKLLDLQSKIDWRNCEKDLETSKTLVEKIRNEFKNYDFTLDT